MSAADQSVEQQQSVAHVEGMEIVDNLDVPALASTDRKEKSKRKYSAGAKKAAEAYEKHGSSTVAELREQLKELDPDMATSRFSKRLLIAIVDELTRERKPKSKKSPISDKSKVKAAAKKN
jgi:hypothetical protein